MTTYDLLDDLSMSFMLIYAVVYRNFSGVTQEPEVESFCKACGLATSEDELGNISLPTKQTTFSCPRGVFQRYSFLKLK